jgi:phosphatidylglycerophosphate synthase
VSPNAISIGSIGLAAVVAAALVIAGRADSRWVASIMYAVAIAGIQGRLLCNLLDGMVAVEHGKASKAGEIYNDLPDRIADALIFAAAGYSAAAHGSPRAIELGWVTAVLAVMTAYVRVLGRSIGAGVYFIGPMAKQHRMALMTLACAACAFAIHFVSWTGWILLAALGIVCLGTVVTMIRRLLRIAADLEARP